jgi:hypothetical protein
VQRKSPGALVLNPSPKERQEGLPVGAGVGVVQNYLSAIERGLKELGARMLAHTGRLPSNGFCSRRNRYIQLTPDPHGIQATRLWVEKLGLSNVNCVCQSHVRILY